MKREIIDASQLELVDQVVDIEIYLLTSLAPIPFATVPNRETGHMGQH